MRHLHTRPRAPAVVFVNQSCLSEGLSRCLALPAYRDTHATHTWRMFSISTARELQPSLGSFLGIWLDHLQAAVRAGGTATLMEVYRQAAAQYYQENPGIVPYDPPTPAPSRTVSVTVDGAVGPASSRPQGAAASAPTVVACTPAEAQPVAATAAASAPASAATAAVIVSESVPQQQQQAEEVIHFGQLVHHYGDAIICDLTIKEFLQLTL